MKFDLAERIEANYKKLWIYSFVSMGFMLLAMIGGGYVATKYTLSQQAAVNGFDSVSTVIFLMSSLFLCFVFLVVSIVYVIKFLYNAWKTVEEPTDNVGAGWRIALLFVPIFSYIWFFFFFAEFAKRANEKLVALGHKKMMSYSAALCYCIINLFSGLSTLYFNMPADQLVSEMSNWTPLQLMLAVFFMVVFMLLGIIQLILLLVWVIQTRRASVKLAELQQAARSSDEISSPQGALN